MGNSASPGLGSSANRGLRDVRLADPETEVERPPASPEPNRKSHEPNRKSPPHNELPVSSKPYSTHEGSMYMHGPSIFQNVGAPRNFRCTGLVMAAHAPAAFLFSDILH